MSKRAMERWCRLKTTESGDGVIEVPSIDTGIETGFGTARYAIGAQGELRLLVPVGVRSGVRALTSTSKLLVTTSSYKISNKNTLFLDIMCLDRALDMVFSEIVEDILRRISEGFSPTKAVSASIDEFRELLKGKPREEISENVILGLVGELEIMRRLVSHNHAASETWTGPFQLRHDFRQGNHALEVKTSRRSDATRIYVTGVDQLAAPVGGTLHLAHMRLECVKGGELSVGMIYDSLLKVGVNRETLDKGLSAVGCSDPYGYEWNNHSFTFGELTVYEVTEGFPRIIGSSFAGAILPAGVSALEYQVDLSHAKSFELTAEELTLAFRRIAG
ncbi:PD-(D/E)XK motif protein [Pseudomonas sp. TWP3-2]|uniref:PD-(D/E)XK motif protein n=1 Tax=Pseudomonas sp. TWP3-2 TaxID=2804574 RepID=UPI003CF42E17